MILIGYLVFKQTVSLELTFISPSDLFFFSFCNITFLLLLLLPNNNNYNTICLYIISRGGRLEIRPYYQSQQ